MAIKLTEIKLIYFVGIKGVAMTALAVYTKERGILATGSDVEEEFPTDEILRQVDIQVLPGFSAHNLQDQKPDLVIFTGAHGGRDNPEVVEAMRLNIPVLTAGQALGEFMSEKKQISIAGCHGKTTTTAILATILTSAGLDPSYAIGCGEIFELGLPAGRQGLPGHFGKGEYFVAEADEYVTDPGHDATPRFMWQNPESLIVTNVDYDHPDAYPSLTAVQDAYRKFRQKVKESGQVIINSDDVNSELLDLDSPKAIKVGVTNNSDYQITDIKFASQTTTFQLFFQGKAVGEFQLKIPGIHNVGNAALAIVLAHGLGLDWETIKTGLAKYLGSKRRFELVGEVNEITIYDDYAHHPAEIKATLIGAREWFPDRRIIAIFQPHTFSRTRALLLEFIESLGVSDLAIITDIYGSAREVAGSADQPDLLARAAIDKLGKKVKYAQSLPEVKQYIKSEAKPGDVIIFMGAGSIYHWSREILKLY